MRTLIVIPCSGRKKEGGENGLAWGRDKSVIHRLPPTAAERLLECRREVAQTFGLAEGDDLGGARAAPVPLMPACRRYDGNLYRKIEKTLWSRVAQLDSSEVVIVSALYGLLTPWEPIRYYNVSMTDHVAHRLRVVRWWSDQGLGRLLAEYVKRSSASMVHDFLSGAYAGVAADLSKFKPAVRVQRHSYPGLGSGADHHRGRDVRALLSRA